MITTDINVICPDKLTLHLIQNRVFNHAHYFSKKDVLDSAFYTYEKELLRPPRAVGIPNEIERPLRPKTGRLQRRPAATDFS